MATGVGNGVAGGVVAVGERVGDGVEVGGIVAVGIGSDVAVAVGRTAVGSGERVGANVSVMAGVELHATVKAIMSGRVNMRMTFIFTCRA